MATFEPGFGAAEGVAEGLAVGVGLKVGIGTGVKTCIGLGFGLTGEVSLPLIQTKYPAKTTKTRIMTTMVIFLLKLI